LLDTHTPAQENYWADNTDVWVYEDGTIAVMPGTPNGPLSAGQATMLRDALSAAIAAQQVIPMGNV
jgi:hypothetical protein